MRERWRDVGWGLQLEGLCRADCAFGKLAICERCLVPVRCHACTVALCKCGLRCGSVVRVCVALCVCGRACVGAAAVTLGGLKG